MKTKTVNPNPTKSVRSVLEGFAEIVERSAIDPRLKKEAARFRLVIQSVPEISMRGRR